MGHDGLEGTTAAGVDFADEPGRFAADAPMAIIATKAISAPPPIPRFRPKDVPLVCRHQCPAGDHRGGALLGGSCDMDV